MPGVLEGDGKGVTGDAPPESERRDKRGMVPEDDNADGGDAPRTYRMAFPAKELPMPCPVEGYSDWALAWTEMRVKFCHWHVRDTVVILEEGNLSHTDLCVTCWCRGGTWIGCTNAQHSANGERSGSNGN